MAKIKQLKDKSGTEQIFPKTKTQAIFNEDGSLLSDTLDDLYGSLATIESSPTTTSHSVGEYILYEGQVYKVTSVIASGDSLVVGTNISAVNLGNQISTLNSKLTNICFADRTSKTTYTIPLTGFTQGNYWFALMYIQTGATAPSLFIIFMNVSNSVYINNIGNTTPSRTFTGVRSGDTIVLTANETVYGGIRVITMN